MPFSGKMKIENSFDVIVIGGGPAGGMCALELAKKGMRVLLTEKFRSFSENNFSSAGRTGGFLLGQFRSAKQL